MKRQPLPAEITTARLIVVLRKLSLERTLDVVALLREVGLSVFEVTLDGDEALETIEALATRGATVGAGTVLTGRDAEAAVNSGAAFVVTPALVEEVIGWCIGAGVCVLPGAFTPTEVLTAWSTGASAVKVFPAATGGPGHVAALKAPLSEIALVPTGGVTDENAGSFLDAGAVAVGVGGWLTTAMDDVLVRERARSLVASVAEAGPGG